MAEKEKKYSGYGYHGGGRKPTGRLKIFANTTISGSPEEIEKLKSLAKEQNIPYQIEAMGGSTGTNADVITINCQGVPTALLSIPLRNMHTCCEVVDIKDIESTASLITAYICGGAV